MESGTEQLSFLLLRLEPRKNRRVVGKEFPTRVHWKLQMVTPTLRTAILKNKVAVQRVLGSKVSPQHPYPKALKPKSPKALKP